MNNFVKIFLFAFVLLVLAGAVTFQPRVVLGQEAPYRILFITSYHHAFQSFMPQVRGFLDGLEAGECGGQRCLLDIEFMDTKRFPDAENVASFRKRLEEKLAKLPDYHVFVIGDDNALRFALAERDTLFAGRPIIFHGINDLATAASLDADPSITGVVEEASVLATLDVIKDISTPTGNIFIIADETVSAQAVIKPFWSNDSVRKKYNLEMLSMSDHSYAELADKLHALPDGNAALFISASRDRTGQALRLRDFMNLITKRSNVPIYTLWHDNLGLGVLGGKLVDPYQQGRASGLMVAEIVAGRPVSDIPVLKESPNVFAFDWNVMQRYGIYENALPKESEVINKPASIYAENKVLIWSVSSIVFGLSFLILVLLFHIIFRRRNERALRESEERFRSVIDNSSSFITLKDADGSFQLVNRKHIEMFGLEQPHVVGKNSFDFLPEKHAAKATAMERKIIETKSSFTEERQIVTKQGTRDFIITKFPILDGSGDVVRIGTIGTDITERKQVEERLRGAVESLQEGFALFDADDRLVAINDVFRRINPKAQEYLEKGMRFEDLIRANIKSGRIVEAIGREEEFIRKRMEQHLNPGPPILRGHSNGEWHIIKESHTPEGGIALTFTDITEHKQAEEDRRLALVEAERANQAKSEFLATMSHELRTPLNAILGFSDILSQQYFGPPGEGKYREYAKDIHASGEHLLELVNDILDISTIEAGKRSLVKEKLATEEIVRECVRIVKNKALSHGIDLITEIPKKLPPLYADKRATKQILLNLLFNSIKFTAEGGKIIMSVKASKRKTTFMVADTGRGISAERLPEIMEPFTRIGRNPFLAEEGWGLGLTITKSLVDLHDGTLDITSEVGKGTTVTVTFPYGAP